MKSRGDLSSRLSRVLFVSISVFVSILVGTTAVFSSSLLSSIEIREREKMELVIRNVIPEFSNFLILNNRPAAESLCDRILRLDSYGAMVIEGFQGGEIQCGVPLNSINKSAYFSVSKKVAIEGITLSLYLTKSRGYQGLFWQQVIVMVLASLLFLSAMYFFLRNLARRTVVRPIRDFISAQVDQSEVRRSNKSPDDLPTEMLEISKLIDSLRENIAQSRTAAALALQARQVAHDIRSPIAALETLLPQLGELSEEKRVFLRTAMTRLRDIANSLKDQRYQDSDQTVLPPVDRQREEHLLPAVESIITEKRLQYRSLLGVDLSFEHGPGAFAIFARLEATEFKRAISNLINNAVESLSEAKGNVSVKLSQVSGFAEITIIDSGCGIPEEVLRRLGEVGNTRGKVNGSGLGLAHAKNVVEKMSGSFEIASLFNGESISGTEVKLRIPTIQAPSWFVSEIFLNSESVVVVFDDDASIHQTWEQRLVRERGWSRNKLVHLSTPESLRNYVQKDDGKSVYLCDNEIIGAEESGFDLIQKLEIIDRAILVTSHHEDALLQGVADEISLRLMPKAIAHLAPILIESPERRLAVILIDDDPLVRKTWESSSTGFGKSVFTYSSVEDFLIDAPNFSFLSEVYVDSNLGDGRKGEQESLVVAAQGFKRIYLATGYEAAHFDKSEMLHISRVTGKNPPWLKS